MNISLLFVLGWLLWQKNCFSVCFPIFGKVQKQPFFICDPNFVKGAPFRGWSHPNCSFLPFPSYARFREGTRPARQKVFLHPTVETPSASNNPKKWPKSVLKKSVTKCGNSQIGGWGPSLGNFPHFSHGPMQK